MMSGPDVLDPDLHPVELLGHRFRGTAAESELVTWREGFQWLLRAGSDDWWEKVSSSFAAKMLLFSECRRDVLRSTLTGVRPGDQILDVACGPGSTSQLLVDLRASSVVGIDSDPAVLALALSTSIGSTASFQLADSREELPFPDDSFDVAHLGDFYDLTPVPEMRRVLRPGGRIIVRATGIAAGVVYSHDQAFDLRVRSAYEQGFVDRFGQPGSDALSWSGRLADAGLAPATTVAIDWSTPIEPLAAAWQLHNASLWMAGHARRHLGDPDWSRLVELWDPDNPNSLLRRRDAHIIQATSWSETVV